MTLLQLAERCEVTQADRDRFADYLLEQHPDATWNNDGRDVVMLAESVRLGQEDQHPMIEMLARHRLDALRACASV